MSTDNNLLSFLQKQSLFSNSPGKPGRRNSSRSRERMQMQQMQNNLNHNQGGNISLSPPRGPAIQDNRLAYQNQFANQNNFQNTPGQFQGQFQGGIVQNGVNHQGNLGGYGVYDQNIRIEQRSQKDSKFSTLSKDVNYSNSYQSARMETSKRLEDIAIRCRTEIHALTNKINMFESEMYNIVSGEFNLVKQRIYQIVEGALRGSDGYVREFIDVQKSKFTHEIIQARQILQSEINAIESMRQDIEKPYWRNTAGVFITRQFEAKVEAAIVQCQTIQMRKIEVQGYLLKDLGRQLFDNVGIVLRRERQVIYGH